MRNLLILVLVGIVVLTGCKANEAQKAPALVTYVVSDADALGADIFKEKSSERNNINTFVIGEHESYDYWYANSAERMNMLREFRNEFGQRKEDFEFEKRNDFKNVKAVIDGELIFGYSEGSDLDKSFEESLVEPDVRSDSIYATSSGAGGGYR